MKNDDKQDSTDDVEELDGSEQTADALGDMGDQGSQGPSTQVAQDGSDDLAALQQELEDLKALSAQLESQLKRAVADYQNLEKRVMEGRSELSSFATTELLKKVVPSLDHFEKALEGASEEDKKSGWYKGVEMAMKQLRGVLKDEGLEQVEIGADGRFDPALHEAVDAREGKEDEVLEVVEKGYTLNGKILKPAKVIVGKKK